jgi:DNA integrity scanning protein DisA with diadenylate cyclase activity
MVKDRFESAKDGEIKKLIEMIETGYRNHIEQMVTAQLKNEAECKWQLVLEDFKRMNPAQRKEHLAYIKKNTNELNDEQLHILKLISLSESSNANDTDIMLGDVKLFSMRKK